MRKLEIVLGDAKFIVSDKFDKNNNEQFNLTKIKWANAPHSHVDK